MQDRHEKLFLYFLIKKDMDQLEHIFGRSRKTLYKDISAVKQKFIDQHKNQPIDIYAIRKYINKLNMLDEETSSINIANIVDQIIDLKVDISIDGIKVSGNDAKQYLENMHEASFLFSEDDVDKLMNDIIELFYVNLDISIKEKRKKTLFNHLYSNYPNYTHNILIEGSVDFFVNETIKQKAKISYALLKGLFNTKGLFLSSYESFLISLYFLVQDREMNNVYLDISSASVKLLVMEHISSTFKNVTFIESNDYDLCISDKEVTGDNIINISQRISFDWLFENLHNYLTTKDSTNVSTIKLFSDLKKVDFENLSYKQFKKMCLTSNVNDVSPNNVFNKGQIKYLPRETTLEDLTNFITTIFVKEEACDNNFGLRVRENIDNCAILENKIVLLHSKDATMYKTEFAFIKAEYPICIGDNGEFQYFLAFSTINDEKFYNAMEHLVKIISDDKFIYELESCSSTSDLIDLF